MLRLLTHRSPLGLGTAIAFGLFLAACTPVGMVVGAGATAGVAAAQERGLAGVTADTAIKGKILQKWLDADHALTTKLGIDVYEGRVLLTGSLSDQVRADRANRLAWQTKGVREVINEVRILPAAQLANGLLDLSRDTWIATKLKASLTMAGDILAINYSITVHDRRVYILGIAQNQAELDRVIRHARRLAAVRRVATFVRNKAPGGGS